MKPTLCGEKVYSNSSHGFRVDMCLQEIAIISYPKLSAVILLASLVFLSVPFALS